MTAIVAISHNGRVFMGADSLVSDDNYAACQLRDPKVFTRSDGIVAGFCGSLRFGQIIALTAFPRRGPNLDLWVRQDVCKALRQAAKDQDFKLGSNISEGDDDSEGIIGVDGEIYVLDVGAVAWRSADAYAAVGSGKDVALGSLYTSKGSPRRRLTVALEAAAAYTSNVRAPWTFAPTR